MSKTPNARTQLRNVWVATVDDLMGMTESELDTELKEMGIDPEVAAQRGKAAVEQATAKSRAIQRERKRQLMEAARGSSGIARDPGVTADVALAENERLKRELKYQDARNSHIGTHGPDCWSYGPKHYECALRHINSITDDGK